MLVRTFKVGEKMELTTPGGERIVVEVLPPHHRQFRLAIDAPREVQIAFPRAERESESQTHSHT